MRNLVISVCLCVCTILAGCSRPTVEETIKSNIDKYEQQYGFPLICFSFYEERWSYSAYKMQLQQGWELEVYWASEDPCNDRFLLIDKNGKGHFVSVNKSHVKKHDSYKGKKAALYYVELQDYHKPGIKKQDLAVKIGIKSNNSEKIQIVDVGRKPKL